MSAIKVTGKHPIKLKDVDCNSKGGLTKKESYPLLDAHKLQIAKLQQRLFAEKKQSLLVVIQAIDTGGKDGTIRHVFSGVNPAGCRVWSFGVPTEDEKAHDVFWRYHQVTPRDGMIGVFNRSYYEEVLVVRVKSLAPKKVWKRRYDEINDFERILANSDTRILKFFLHIDRDEQKERLQARLDDPEKHWKFNPADLNDRASWDDYQDAFEDAVNTCGTQYAPWYVIPANRKWHRNLLIAEKIAQTLEDMDPQWPEEADGLEDIVIPD